MTSRKTLQMFRNLLSIVLLLLLPACGSTTGIVEGKAVWSSPDGEKPISGAIVELHTVSPGGSKLLAQTISDGQGNFSFKELQPGSYIIPIIMWESQDNNNPCPSGTPWQMMIAGWMDTKSSDSGIKGLVTNGLEVDQTGIDQQLVKTREKGVPWLGFAATGKEFNLEAGKTMSNTITLECR